MRAMIVMPWGERLGGAETMLWALLRHLDRSRVEPQVVALQPGPFVDEIADLGIATSVVEAGRLREAGRAAATVRRLARVFRRRRPDMILNWSPKTQLYGGAAACVARLSDRVVWWQHGIPSGQWLDRLATALPARAVGCSSHAAAAAQRRLWPHRPTFVVHPGVESPPPPHAWNREDLRAQLGIPADRVVIGMVGRLQPDKGQHLLLQAIPHLRDRGLDPHALLIGGDAYGLSPGYVRYLEQTTGELGLGDRVTMTGQLDSITRYVLLSDVLVNATAAESFGIVLLEAMALGVPVLALASGGPLELIEPHHSGMLADRADPIVLAQALAELIIDDDLRQRLAAEGQRTAARFSASRMAERMQDEIETVISRAV